MTCPHCDSKTAATKAFDQEWCPNCGAFITLKDRGSGASAQPARVQVPKLIQNQYPADLMRQLQATKELEIGGMRFRVERIDQ